MKLGAVNSMSKNQNTVRGYVCKPLTERANRFCSPVVMQEYRNSTHIALTDANTKKVNSKYVQIKSQTKTALRSLEHCMKNKFDNNTYLSVRKVKENPGKSVLSLFNTNTGKIMDVSSHFDTKYGNISRVLNGFVKRAHNYAHEIQKDTAQSNISEELPVLLI